MVMERAVVENERRFDHELDDAGKSMLPNSLRAIFLELDPNPPLPAGWEKCLDLQSGLIYFKDWNTGTSTYKDPRKQQSHGKRNSFGTVSDFELGWNSRAEKLGGDMKGPVEEKCSSWKDIPGNLFPSSHGELANLELTLKVEASETRKVDNGVEQESASVTSNAGYFSAKAGDISSGVRESVVCTVEKVKDALRRCGSMRSNCTNSSLSSLHSLSISLPSPTAFKLPAKSCRSVTRSKSRRSPSPSISYGSSSSQSSSHSVMSFQGEELDDSKEEATSCKACDSTDESEEAGVMVTLGCKRCLMYIMLSKDNPSCPKCGSTSLLEICSTSMPKRQKVE